MFSFADFKRYDIFVPSLRSFLVLTTVPEGTSCDSCFCILKNATRLSRSNWANCCLCCRQFCTKCIKEFKLEFSKSIAKFEVCLVCWRFLLRVQLRLDPWFNTPVDSRFMFDLNDRFNKEHTQLCSRLSNYDGLMRFFAQHKDRVPRADLVGPLPELENGIRASILVLTKILKEATPRDEVSDTHVCRGLVNYFTYHLTRIKAQFNLSFKLYESLLGAKAFSTKPV